MIKKRCFMKNDLYSGLLNLIAPKELVENFELVEIVENTGSISLLFEELASKVPKSLEGKDVVLDGFMNKVELQTFPLKDKTVYFVVRRRRWKEKNSPKESYSNPYDLHIDGMKTTKEFGAFLKEELGLQPDEYNKLWERITN